MATVNIRKKRAKIECNTNHQKKQKNYFGWIFMIINQVQGTKNWHASAKASVNMIYEMERGKQQCMS